MIKKALLLGLLGFIVVFGIQFMQNRTAEGKSSDTTKDILSLWQDKAMLFSNIVAEAVSDEDDIVAGILLQNTKNLFKGSKYITVIANDGTILADLDTTRVGETYSGPRITGNITKITSRGNLVDIGAPVIFADERVGEVHIGLYTETLAKKQKTQNTLLNSLLYSLIAFVLIFAVGIPLTRGGVVQREGEASIEGLETLNEEVEKLKEVINKLHEEEESLTSTLDEKRKMLSDLDNQINQKQEELKSIDEDWQNIGEKRMQVEEIRAELSKLTVELEDRKKELEEVKKQIAEGKATLASAPQKSEEEALLDSLVGEGNIDERIEEKKRQEVELTQRIVAKRREEIALSARVEAKRKELIELERKIEELKGQLKG